MRSLYGRSGLNMDSSMWVSQKKLAPRTTSYSSSTGSRSAREAISIREKTESDAEAGSDSETADGYAELRAKMRSLQREATKATSDLDALSRAKEELSVALSHAKRDKAKAIADSEVLSLERDSLERENRRVKSKLDAASKELRELLEERRTLSERLKVVEVMKRSALADDKDTKSLLSKMQDDIQSLRQQNMQLEEKLQSTQDQLRRSKLLSSIASSTVTTSRETHPASTHYSRDGGSSTQRSYGKFDSDLESSEEGPVARPPRVSVLALSGLTRDRFDSTSLESPPHTPSRSTPISGFYSPAASIKTDVHRVEHLKVDLEVAKKELAKLQDTNQDLTKKLRESERELSASKSANRHLESESAASASAIKSATRRADDAESRRKELLSENAALQEAESKMRAQIEQVQRDLTRAKEEASTARALLEKAEAAAKKEVDAKRKALEELATAEKALSGKEAERTQLTRSVSKTAVDLQGSRDELAQMEVKSAKVEREVQNLTNQIAQLKVSVSERQAALDVAHNEARAHLEKIRDLSASLSTSEESHKKSAAKAKKAEELAADLQQRLLTSEQARESAVSDLEHRKQDLALQESEVQRLKSAHDFLEKSVAAAKKAEQDSQNEVLNAKRALDRANAELQVATITIEQLQRDASSQQAKAISAAVSGTSNSPRAPGTPKPIGDVDVSPDLELKLRELGQQVTTAQKEKLDAETKLSAAEKERDKNWNDVKALQTKLNQANADLQMGGRIVTDLQAKLKEAEQKFEKSEEDAKRLHEKQEKVADALRSDLGNAKREIKIKDGVLATHQSTIADLNAKLKAAQENHSNGSHQSNDLEAIQSELNAAKQSLTEAQTQLDSAKRHGTSLETKVKESDSRVKELTAQLSASSSATSEIEKLKIELNMSKEVTESSTARLEKLQAELEKTKHDATKQAKSDSQLRKTLSRQCEQWQHQVGALESQIDKIRKEMIKNPSIRTALEPIVGAPVATSAPTTGTSQSDDSSKVILIQAACRGALSRLKHKHWRYRHLKVKEMVDTEESYLKALDLGWNYFLYPLQTLVKVGDSIITQEEIDLIFTSLADIRKNNKEVLSMLKARLNSWHVNQLIGDVFNDILSKGLLQPHVTFAQAYSKSTENRVRITKENVGFSRLQAVIRMLPPMEGRSLEDILISPIQRIPRYILLLSDMVKHTMPNHADYNNLVNANQAFQRFATFINENNRRAETMTDIHTRLGGYESIPENPNRKLIHEGRLLSITKSEKTPRYVFLFSDFIVFGKESKNKKKGGSVKGNDTSKVTTKFLAMIKISSTVTVSEIGSREIGGTVFHYLLSVMVGESANLLQANSESDMKLWVGKLRDTIDEQQAGKSPQIERRHASPSPQTSHDSSSSSSQSSHKDKSNRRLSVGSAGSSGNGQARAVSPSRTSSMSSIPIKELPEDIPILISSSSSHDLITSSAPTHTTTLPALQSSSSSGSLEVGGSSRKSRTLAKRHKNSAKSSTSNGAE